MPPVEAPSATIRARSADGARWTMGGAKVASGELPPGLTLEDGQIGGVPKQAGSYQFRIEFSNVMCAGKPYDGHAVDVSITVK